MQTAINYLEQHSRAFDIAKTYPDSIIDELFNVTSKCVKNGSSFNDFRNRCAAVFLGLKPNPDQLAS